MQLVSHCIFLDPSYEVGWVSSSDRAVSDALKPVQRKITRSEAAKSTSVLYILGYSSECRQCSVVQAQIEILKPSGNVTL